MLCLNIPLSSSGIVYLDFDGKTSPMLQILREDYSYKIDQHLRPTTIWMNDLEQSGVDEFVQCSVPYLLS